MTVSRRAMLEQMIEAGKLEIVEIDTDDVMKANTLADLAKKQINAYTNAGNARKNKYHSIARRKLRKFANLLCLTAKDYRLDTNAGGIAVCGETTLHTDTLYIQVSQSCFGVGNEIMFRRCNGRSDYTGKQNHFAPAGRLDDVADFREALNRAGIL